MYFFTRSGQGWVDLCGDVGQTKPYAFGWRHSAKINLNVEFDDNNDNDDDGSGAPSLTTPKTLSLSTPRNWNLHISSTRPHVPGNYLEAVSAFKAHHAYLSAAIVKLHFGGKGFGRCDQQGAP